MTAFDGITQFFGNLDAQTLGGTSIAAILAAVWYFARVIRKIIGTAFSLCIVYVLLRLGGVDVGEFVQNLMKMKL